MKLYLSSYRVPVAEVLFELLPDEKKRKAAIITNAKDYHPPEERGFKLNALKEDLAEIGINGEFINLLDFNNPVEMEKKLGSFDLLFACGGNTFALRYAMRASGFDETIRPLLIKGIVYAGESAGAIVAGQSLRGFDEMDDSKVVPEIIWDGLDLIDAVIAPHSDNPDYAPEMPALQRLYEGYPNFIELGDKQAYVIDGKESKVVTAGK